MSKLFHSDIEPRCAYCARSRVLSQEQVVCEKKGVVSAGDHCRAFRYDPLRRVPPRPVKLKLSGLKDEDFQL